MSLVTRSAREAIRCINGKKMLQNSNPAIELIKQQPIKAVKARQVFCDGGNTRLGHPRVYISLDHGVHTCGYCGQRFQQDHSH